MPTTYSPGLTRIEHATSVANPVAVSRQLAPSQIYNPETIAIVENRRHTIRR